MAGNMFHSASSRAVQHSDACSQQPGRGIASTTATHVSVLAPLLGCHLHTHTLFVRPLRPLRTPPGGMAPSGEKLLERWTLKFGPLPPGSQPSQGGQARAGGCDDAAVYKRMVRQTGQRREGARGEEHFKLHIPKCHIAITPPVIAGAAADAASHPLSS